MDLPHSALPDRRRRGLLIVLSSPSGAGKSTISRMLLKADPEVTMSISATTRPMRPGERDDVDYHFVADPEFDRADRGRRVRRMGAGVRLSLRHAQGAGEGRAQGRAATSCSTSTGRARSSSIRRWARTSSASSSCRRRWPNSSAACAIAAPTATRSSPAACSAPRARSAIGPNMIMCWSTATPKPASPKSRRSSPPNASSARARRGW